MKPVSVLKARMLSLWRSFLCLPSGRGWLECLLIALPLAAAVGVVGFGSGILRLESSSESLWRLGLGVLIVPAFSEELIFRGLMIPAQDETRHPILWISITTALIRYRTGSLWPAVVFHGAFVFLWKAFLGGPSLSALMR